MPSDLSTHVEEVHSLNWGGATNRDPLIRDSWNRCLNEYGIDPADLRKANILTDHQLHHHRDAMEELLRTARFGVEALYRQVSSLGYVVLLTDGDGITVDSVTVTSATALAAISTATPPPNSIFHLTRTVVETGNTLDR